ncbi:endonuclease domain-containing protein [Sphingomonas sp. HITSZ_GF]|uniref:endonuclease domain-containing protein n=1 Tax=Sphingomonas sp. HITSZ_GF TaxID=3037247 RepID=UPI00240DC85B|nr:endonuclease domain-containing protein [Sphingomonas sp. HITSZ_GF]MDG2535543.1 endonuclease domain-containing protein [Sphingomonas sp. HITSZ_GF]
MTPPELRLWGVLRTEPEGHVFRRQHEAGDYVLDFYCARSRLAVEVDGEIHARGDQPARDGMRDAWLATRGVRVLRIPAIELLHELDGVVRHIVGIAAERRTAPSTTGCAGGPPPPELRSEGGEG